MCLFFQRSIYLSIEVHTTYICDLGTWRLAVSRGSALVELAGNADRGRNPLTLRLPYVPAGKSRAAHPHATPTGEKNNASENSQ
jgi:hypothetical protein